MLVKSLSYIPPDAIFALTSEYNADESPVKVNLGQGTYKDGSGQPHILSAVKLAKERLQNMNHEYLPILGLPSFREQTLDLLLGSDSALIMEKKVSCMQTLSGTGALHVAGAFLRKSLGSSTTVYVTEPSWSNHRAVFESVGLSVVAYQYTDEAGAFDFATLIKTLEQASKSSVFVFHACAHNPCGRDPSTSQWKQIAEIMLRRELIPVFDAAYLGLASGNFDTDSWAIRYFINDLKMEAIVCLSFAKVMGLYGERVGFTMLSTRSQEDATIATSQLEQLQRAEISNPPAYGARIVARVLEDQKLQKLWRQDLTDMNARLVNMRVKLCKELKSNGCAQDMSHIGEQVGMFGILGLDSEQVQFLKEKHHIYMAGNSRISIAGLNDGNVAYVAKCISEVMSNK